MVTRAIVPGPHCKAEPNPRARQDDSTVMFGGQDWAGHGVRPRRRNTGESTVDSGAGAMPAPERAIYFTLEKSASNCMVCPSCNVTITVVLAFGSNDSYPNRAVKRDR